ncbi:MAG: hypothetical protein JWQ71_4969 [Pedosphaera sp.]|nr:hypothetical protein [Pedosphaera sp.]
MSQQEKRDTHAILLEAESWLGQINRCQGPWNVDLRTPPGQECSNGSLLCIRRGHPGIFKILNGEFRMANEFQPFTSRSNFITHGLHLIKCLIKS